MEFSVGDRVRLVFDSRVLGTVLFIKDGDITVEIDGYEASNCFTGDQLELVSKAEDKQGGPR